MGVWPLFSKPVAMTVTLTVSERFASVTTPKMISESSWAACWTRPAASLISRSLMSGPAVKLIRMPVAPCDRNVVEERRVDRHLSRLERPSVALGDAGAHQRATVARHDGLHVGEIDVDHAGVDDQVADALNGLQQHVVGARERVEHRDVVIAQRHAAADWES